MQSSLDQVDLFWEGFSPSTCRKAIALIARGAIEAAVMETPEARNCRYWRRRFIVYRCTVDASGGRQGHRLWQYWSELVHYQSAEFPPNAKALRNKVAETEIWLDQHRVSLDSDRAVVNP